VEAVGRRRHHLVGRLDTPYDLHGGPVVPAQLGGALVTETVFTWPGMGRLFMDSLNYRDYPVVLGVLMLTAVLTLLGSLIANL